MIWAASYKMIREILRVSFLLVVLLHFNSTPHYFLNATQPESSQGNVFRLQQNSVLIQNSNESVEGSSRTIENYSHVLEGVKDHSQFVNEFPSSSNGVQESKDDIIVMERKLLQLLGMSERPKPMRDKHKASIHIPKFIVELYNNQLDLELPTSHLNLPGRFTRNANTVRSFYSAGTEIDLPGLHAHLRYDINSIPTFEEITGAELHVPFTLTSPDTPKSFQVLVHDVVKVSSRKSRDLSPITYPVDTKLVSSSTHQNSSQFWLAFDVFPAISRHIENRKPSSPLPTIGLAVQLLPRSSSTSQTSLDNLPILSPEQPILHTYSDDGKNPKKNWTRPTLSRHPRSVRNKRRSRNHHRHKNRRKNLCSRKRMFVDFTDVGWNDWIVAPPGYQAFFCSGECPFPMAEHLNATNHAVIQALVNSMNPRLVPPPCCVPNKYSSLSLLYTDSSDRIVLKNYNEMIVDSCGCS